MKSIGCYIYQAVSNCLSITNPFWSKHLKPSYSRVNTLPETKHKLSKLRRAQMPSPTFMTSIISLNKTFNWNWHIKKVKMPNCNANRIVHGFELIFDHRQVYTLCFYWELNLDTYNLKKQHLRIMTSTVNGKNSFYGNDFNGNHFEIKLFLCLSNAKRTTLIS